MLALITGKVVAKDDGAVIVDVNGLGFEVKTTEATITSLEINSLVKLQIVEQISENAYNLFGFVSLAEVSMFKLLTTVNGIGPKAGLSLIELGEVETLKAAIVARDHKYLCQAKGVGSRAADRIVVDLKNKIKVDGSANLLGQTEVRVNQEAVDGLMSLGYNRVEATDRLANVDKQLPVEEQISIALKE